MAKRSDASRLPTSRCSRFDDRASTPEESGPQVLSSLVIDVTIQAHYTIENRAS